MSDDVSDPGNDRIGFTVFLSACAHAILILGVGFSYLDNLDEQATLEITLAQYRSDETPENPDFLAQENQLGSGTLDQPLAPSTPVAANFQDDEIVDVQPQPRRQIFEQILSDDLAVITAIDADQALRQQQENKDQPAEHPQPDPRQNQAVSLSIQTLRAQLDLKKQAYAMRPRRYTISSASTRRSEDALYLDSWRKRIESVGNLNYPERARQEKIYGSLRLLVAIRPDGSVDEIRILRSSNSSVLDEAAMNIVRLASPFEPFPAELRGQTDILEVIRTWRFHDDSDGPGFSSY